MPATCRNGLLGNGFCGTRSILLTRCLGENGRRGAVSPVGLWRGTGAAGHYALGAGGVAPGFTFPPLRLPMI